MTGGTLSDHCLPSTHSRSPEGDPRFRGRVGIRVGFRVGFRIGIGIGMFEKHKHSADHLLPPLQFFQGGRRRRDRYVSTFEGPHLWAGLGWAGLGWAYLSGGRFRDSCEYESVWYRHARCLYGNYWCASSLAVSVAVTRISNWRHSACCMFENPSGVIPPKPP